MNDLQVFNNPSFGKIRTLETNEGKVLFCGKDVAEALGYKRTADAIREHCKGVSEIPTPSNGGIQPMKYITESDVYRLTFSSKLPTAEEFTDWVTEEVLPSIRRTGSYGAQNGYRTALSSQEVKDIIMNELVVACINIEKHLGLSDLPKETPPEPPKRFRTKLGQLPEKDRNEIDRIIKESSSYEQAAYKIQTVISIRISASGVRNYVKEAGLRR